jgi:hypothetical protein
VCFAYLGVAAVGQSEARSVARCRTTLLILSTLKLVMNFAFLPMISCSWCSSNSSCSSAGKVSLVDSMMLVGETSKLSFEPAIEDRSNRSSCEVPRGVTKKCVGTDPAPITAIRTGSGTLCGGTDDPRPRARRSTTWRRGQGFCLTSRTVRACAGATEFADVAWISLLGGTPSRRRDPKVCLGINRSPKTPLNDIESERGED